MDIYNIIARRISRTARKLPAVAVHTLDVAVAALLSINQPTLGALYGLFVAITAAFKVLEESTAMCEGPHPFIPADRGTKVELIYNQLGESVENVLNFWPGLAGPAPNLTDLAVSVLGAWEDHLKPWIASNVTLDMVRVTDTSSETGGVVEYAVGLPQPGGNSNPIQNGAQTLAVKFTTDQRGRSYRGRVYMVGVPAYVITSNVANATYLANLTAGWNAFMTQVFVDTGVYLAVVSTCGNGVWRTAAIQTIVTGIAIDAYADSQRRRLHGRGQ